MKSNRLLLLCIMLFCSIINTQAQQKKEVLEFLHSGELATKNKTIKVPFEIWNDFILLNVKVNGNNTTFLWDNGFSASAIDSNYVKKFTISSYNSELTLNDANNQNVKVNQLVCKEFMIGELVITNTPFLRIDIQKFFQSDKLEFTGIIGASIINKLNWSFNFDENFVEISDKPFPVLKKSRKLAYKIVPTNIHIMDIKLNGYKTECLIDFGSNSDKIVLNNDFLTLFPDSKKSNEFGLGRISISGFANVDTTYFIKKDYRWKLSKNKFDFLPNLMFSKHNNKTAIGNKLFRNQYNVIINTQSNSHFYILNKRKSPLKPSLDKSYGLKIILKNGQLCVGKLISNLNTINKGIKLMEEIKSIDGKTASHFKNNFELFEFQQNHLENNKVLIIEFKNGSKIKLSPQKDIEY